MSQPPAACRRYTKRYDAHAPARACPDEHHLRRCKFQGESQTDGRVLVAASDLLRRRQQAEQSLSLRLLSTVRASWAEFFVPLSPNSIRVSHLGRRRSADHHFSVVSQRTLCASRISHCPIRVSHLTDPRHRPRCRREIHTSRATLVSSSLSPILSAMATDGSGTASRLVHAGPAGYRQ
jgi:hypothetical protein